VYLGVPVDEFGRRRTVEEVRMAREAFGIRSDTFAIGTVTRLMPSKGNQYLVEAARAVLDAIPNARVFIFGEGELQPELEAQARRLGLGDRLVFVGFVRDVASALAALDLVVFPSLWEGTPITAFEALAAGKPIVSTDADGLKDILTDGRDAVLVPRRDAAALAQTIVALAHDADRRSALGARARETGRRYDIDAFVRKMQRLYVLLHETSQATGRAGILRADLSFLDRGV
jgi:glycosyltransferase involved in cell wall biosynthesis